MSCLVVYLASPNTQQQAEHVSDMPVLLSYACYSNWLDKGYQQSFGRILIDSGAYSEMNSGKKVDVVKYAEWARSWGVTVDAWAGLDDIRGDWRRSMENYKHGGFPTIHDSDPPELLADLVQLSVERGNWLGIGLLPPREGKERFVRWVCDNVPESLHLHGWALRRYTHVRRLDSVDSTNWWRDAMAIRQALPWLTYGEALEIVVKRYQRETRVVREAPPEKVPHPQFDFQEAV